MSPTVSVIIPALNEERFVAATLESVRQQTYPHWEVIVVDDGSSDGTVDIVRGYSDRDDRIRLLRNSIRNGPGAPRNVGLGAASGRFVAFLDADDLWLPAKLERQVDFMSATGAALSYTQFRRVTEDQTRVGRLIDVPDQLDFVGLLKNTAITTSTVMLDRDRTGPVQFDLGLKCDDYTLYLKILRQGHTARGLREDLMRYRVAGGSISRNKQAYAREMWKLYHDWAGIGLPRAAWYFAHYAVRGVVKYSRF